MNVSQIRVHHCVFGWYTLDWRVKEQFLERRTYSFNITFKPRELWLTLTLFFLMFPFDPLKTLENLWFSDVFKGKRDPKGTFWRKELTDFMLMFHFFTPESFSDVFRGYRSGIMAWNGLPINLITLMSLLYHTTLKWSKMINYYINCLTTVWPAFWQRSYSNWTCDYFRISSWNVQIITINLKRSIIRIFLLFTIFEQSFTP